MRYFYMLLLFCLTGETVLSQGQTDSLPVKKSIYGAPCKVVIRCSVNMANIEPLWIVNGLVSDPASVRKIDPTDIQSIDILKDAAATALYGCRAAQGVIIITTRSGKFKQFNIKDGLDDRIIPGATVTFISTKNEKDSLRFIADQNGTVRTGELKTGEQYKVLVSSVGYKAMQALYDPASIAGVSEYRLTRDVKESQEVVVVGYLGRRRGCGSCWIVTRSVSTTGPAEVQPLPVRVYPNPLQGGTAVKMEIDLSHEKPLQLRIMNLSGTVLRSIAYRSFKGVNRVEIPTAGQWAAGMYFLQVLDEKGKLLKQDKLLIQ